MTQATYVADAGAIDHTPSTALSAGDVVLQGNGIAISKLAIAASVLGTLHTLGLFDISKVTGAIADEADLYWDDDGDPEGGTAGTGAATTARLGPYIGRAVGAAGSSDTTVRVELAPQQRPTDITEEIADPGDAAAIPVVDSGYVDLVTAGAETRTIAAPTYVGQQLLLSLKTDGGDAVITVATTINQSANTVITMADAGDAVLLVAKTNGANLRWSVGFNDGAALS